MNLFFESALAYAYNSSGQKARILSEDWVHRQIYCPSCGMPSIERYVNNSPAADFFCSRCNEDFELKSQAKIFGARMVDGAYRTMIERLEGNRNPNLLLLQYDPDVFSVTNFLAIPKYFFIPQIIEERKPLSRLARRAGWIGCNISLQGIPHAGRIFLIKDRIVEPKAAVLAKWQNTLFLGDQKDIQAKAWILSVMKCIEKLHKYVHYR